MKSKIQYITLLAASAGMLVGCASQRQAGSGITVTPEACVLVPEDGRNADMDVVFHVPDNYFTKRSRLVITPQLMVGDTVKEEYLPLVVDAPIYKKKLKRREVLENYTDTLAGGIRKVENTSAAFELPYSESVVLPAGIDTAHVVAVVSTDGCGECTGIDTIEVASIGRPSLYIQWIELKFVVRPKVVDGKGEARLAFEINKYDINMGLGNNRSELEAMLEILTPVLKDTLATVNSFTISGMASADGSLAFNTRLAENRANAAKDWVADRLNLTSAQKNGIKTDSRPEGWRPVLDSMIKDGNPDSVKVKDILERFSDQNDDVQERHIRRLACWNTIRDRYLSKDRKVEYTYSYTIKSFTTDSELLDMYAKRPDAFNEPELLKVSTLMQTDAERIGVYQTILKYFPDSETAKNNLVVLYLRTGNEKAARSLLRQLSVRYPDIEGKQLKVEGEE
ncbi:hypothetical protein [Parabacteroides distasonis]|uniref:hypothetical protein n=1 Tax=Parabacteroides distasonis TaxID=823 RepID=UPI003F1EFDD8